jgi:Tol biopolymer transport system component
VTLRWTAPGNDGTSGRASEYDLRRARAPITEATWNEAVRVEGLPQPALPGTVRSFVVSGLQPATSYFFALKTADGVPNWSAVSNGVGRSTLSIALSRLTSSDRLLGAEMPAWSPDGQTIAVSADWQGPLGHLQVFLVPSGGGVPVPLTDDPEPLMSQYPCWSPDGTQIAFASENSLHGDEVYVMGATPDAASVQVTQLGVRELHDCAWSPDGTRIAFTALVGDTPGETTYTIYIVPSTGGTAAALVGADAGREPAWSPDGAQIAFTSDRSGNNEIYVVSAQGGEPTQLTDDPAWDSWPAWSPDGGQIAFASNRAGNFDIWLMSSDGRDPISITSDPMDEVSPSWSPDGTRISFDRWTSDAISDIWILAGQEMVGR